MINSRNKGKRGELELVGLLSEYWPECCRNIDQFKDDKRDVLHTPGVHWQVKRVEKLNIWAALQQAEGEAAEHDVPVVAFRRNRSGWKAALDLHELVALLRLKEF